MSTEDAPVETVRYGDQEFQAAPTRKRARATARDMVITMAVLGLGVAVWWILAWRPTTEATVKVVDWKQAAASAAAASGYQVLVPATLPATWQATSARFETETSALGHRVWHVGFVTPGGKYAGVEQTDADAAYYLPKALAGAQATGTVEVNGRQWQVYGPGSNGWRSLVRAEGASTVVVTGSANEAELQQLAASLSAQPR